MDGEDHTNGSRNGQPGARGTDVDTLDRTTEAMAELTERERQVLFEYFIKGHSQSEIAADHHVSQMQVSRWIIAALGRVRSLLA